MDSRPEPPKQTFTFSRGENGEARVLDGFLIYFLHISQLQFNVKACDSLRISSQNPNTLQRQFALNELFSNYTVKS